jgi:hypothetical protein
MATIHIVCAQQAARTAELLERVLTAEEHLVTVSSGRFALLALETPREQEEFVIVIWSPQAEAQTYLAEWAARTDPDRLIELSVSTPHPPKIQRRAPVIDFSAWRGERGGRAWNALTERLRAVIRAAELAKTPPLQAAAALAAMGALVIGGGLMVRMESGPVAPTIAMTPDAPPVISSPTGIGGAVEIEDLFEPPSVGELPGGPLPPRLAALTRYHPAPLAEIGPYEPAELRDPTLLERIRDFNPLRSDRRDSD